MYNIVNSKRDNKIKLKWKLSLHILVPLIFLANLFVVLFYPEIVKVNPNIAMRNFRIIFTSILFSVFSFFWYNHELSLKLGLIFRIKKVDLNEVTDLYIFVERVGCFLALLVTAFAVYAFV